MIVADILYEYEKLRNRCLEDAGEPAESGYIEELWSRWDSQLRWYAAHHDVPNMDRVTSVINDPLLSASARLEWLDAYPAAAVAQLRNAQ